MHFFRTSAAVLLSACLAQVIASPAGAQSYSNDDSTGVQPNGISDNQGNGSGNGQGQGDQNGQSNQGLGQASNRNGTEGVPHRNKHHQGQGNGQIKNQVDNNLGQVTVTVTAAASTAQPLTVMTVTVTAPCTAGNNANPNGNANAVSTSVIAAPTAAAADTEATPARQFVTAASAVPPGLTSLPVAVASALGNGGNAAAGTTTSSSQSVSPGNFATVSSGVFTGKTFTTTGNFVPGVVTSIPVADAIPSFVKMA